MDSPTVPLPEPSRLLSESWRILIDNFGHLLSISLLPLLPAVIGLTITFIVAATYGFIHTSNTILPSAYILMFLLFIPLVIILMVSSLWSSVAMLFAIKSIFDHQPLTISGSFKQAWPKLFKYWWLMLLSGLIVTGGFFLFVIPGIILSVWFCAAMFVFVDEDLGGMAALMKSKAYIRGHAWAILGRVTLVSLIIFGLVMATSILYFIPIIGSLARLAIQFVSNIFVLIYTYLLFRYLKQINPHPDETVSSKSKVLITLSCLGIFIFPILGILMSIALIAINPSAKIKQAQQYKDSPPVNTYVSPTETYNPLSSPAGRDLIRRKDLSHISQAISDYLSDHPNKPLENIGSTASPLSSTGANLCSLLVPKYIIALPVDPSIKDGLPISYCKSTYNTGYAIHRSSGSNLYNVSAPYAELDPNMSISPPTQ